MGNKKNNKFETIDLVLVLKKLIFNKKKIFLFGILLSFFGAIYSLFLPNIFKSYSKFYPHYEEVNNSSNLRNLAGIAGINFNTEISNNIPPNLYPELINSTSFKLEILNQKIPIKENISYREYLMSKEASLIQYINPKKIYNMIGRYFKKNQNNSSDKVDTNLNFISEEDNELFKTLNSLITLEIDEDNNIIVLSVYDEIPVISALIAESSKEILQKKIIDFKLKNINDIFIFTSNQLDIAQSKLHKIQDSLAKFKDNNISIKSDLFLNQLNRLETELNIQKNVYNELAITKEKTAIDVRKNTPIFTIIDSVVVPNKKHMPNRLGYVFLFFIIGISISSIWFLSKKTIILIYKEIYKN